MKKEEKNEDIIDVEELIISTSLELEAVIEVLIERKLITKEEVLNKMRNIVKKID